MRPELLLLGLGVVLVGWLRKQAAKNTEGHSNDQRGTWRAGSSHRSAGSSSAQSETAGRAESVRFNDVPTSSGAGPDATSRDAFTGERLRPDTKIFQCIGCKSYYHEESVELLRRENAGRCASCNSRDIVRDKIAEQVIVDADAS